MNKKVLITDSFSKHSIALLKYLNKESSDIEIYGHTNDLKLYKSIIKNFYYNKVFFGDLKSIIKKHDSKFDFVIPVWAESVLYLSSIDYKKTIIPNNKQINLCFDKFLINEKMNLFGIKFPKTFLLSQYNNELKNKNIIIKHRNELNKGDIDYINRGEKINFLKTNNKIVQEKIEGVGRGFFAFYKKGKLINYYMHERVREVPFSGGPSIAAKTIYDQKLYKIGKKILDNLKWNGVAMVEFKYDKINDEYYFIEINPKFWGSLELGLKSGINFGKVLVDSYFNRLEHKITYNKGIKFYWPLDGDIITILNERKLFILLDYLKFDYYTNVTLKLFLFKFIKMISKIF